MVTVKEFSVQEGVTTQAIYKLLKTHAKALEGHIQSTKKGRLLDETAQNYLRERMVGNSVVVYDRKLENEIEELKAKLKATQDELIMKNAMILEAQNRVFQLEDQSSKIENLEAELNGFKRLVGNVYIKKGV